MPLWIAGEEGDPARAVMRSSSGRVVVEMEGARTTNATRAGKRRVGSTGPKSGKKGGKGLKGTSAR
jgi:hypothetical protein